MANPEHLDLLTQGVEQWNTWRQKHRDVRADLSGANLSGADLSRANLSGALQLHLFEGSLTERPFEIERRGLEGDVGLQLGGHVLQTC